MCAVGENLGTQKISAKWHNESFVSMWGCFFLGSNC